MLNNNAGRIKPSCIIFHKIREFSLVCPVVNHQKLPENEPLSVSPRASHLLRCLTPIKTLQSASKPESISFHALENSEIKVHKSSKFFRVRAVFN